MKLKAFLTNYWHLIMYVVVTALTVPFYHADIREYSEHVLLYANGDPGPFWEFGHLLLRPLVYAAWSALGTTIGSIFGYAPATQLAAILVSLAWLSGALAVHSLRRLLECLGVSGKALIVTLVAFLFASSILNFSQAGTSYMPGLAFVLLGLWLTIRSDSAYVPLSAGISFTLGVAFWTTYLWALPGCVLASILLQDRKPTARDLIRTGASVGLPLIIIFGVGALLEGVTSVDALSQWIFAASHGDQRGGWLRVVFGLPRSFLFMGDDGVLIRRYLDQDPYNPVSLWQVFSLGTWKIVLFYTVFSLVAWGIFKAHQNKLAIWVIISITPVLLFAASWDGAAVERYLPLYPALFVMFAIFLKEQQTLLRFAGYLFAVILVCVNGWQMFSPRVMAFQQPVRASVKRILSSSNSKHLFVVLNVQDDVFELKRNSPFDPIARDSNFVTHPLLLGSGDSLRSWRNALAEKVLSAWEADQEVWIQSALFNDKPAPWLYWAEGSDLSVRWRDVHAWAKQLQTIPTDLSGFVKLARSSQNIHLLQNWLER